MPFKCPPLLCYNVLVTNQQGVESTIKYLIFILLLPFRFVWWIVCLILHAMGLGWRRSIRSNADYVRFVTFFLKRNGFTHIYPPEDSPPGSVDLLAAKGGKHYVVFCHYANQEVGLDPIQQAAPKKEQYRADGVIIVTNQPMKHSAWIAAHSQHIVVCDDISPEKRRTAITTQMLLTPKNVVAFALGCVAFGAWFSEVFPNEEMDISAYCMMALGCLVLSWSACTFFLWLLRQQRDR